MNEAVHANAAAGFLRDERGFLQKRVVAEDSWIGSSERNKKDYLSRKEPQATRKMTQCQEYFPKI